MTVRLKGWEKVVGELDVLQKTQLGGWLKYAMVDTARHLVVSEREEIKRTFNRTVPFTINAPLTSKIEGSGARFSFTFFHRNQADRGQSPDRYLAPQVYGGEVYVTRFTRRLRYSGKIGPRQYVLHWLDTGLNGPVTPGLITKILFSLGADEGFQGARKTAKAKANLGQYFIEDRRNSVEIADFTRGSKSRTLRRPDGYDGPGIYTRRGDRLQRIFRILDKVPTVPAKYNWSEARLAPIAEKQFATQMLVQMRRF